MGPVNRHRLMPFVIAYVVACMVVTIIVISGLHLTYGYPRTMRVPTFMEGLRLYSLAVAAVAVVAALPTLAVGLDVARTTARGSCWFAALGIAVCVAGYALFVASIAMTGEVASAHHLVDLSDASICLLLMSIAISGLCAGLVFWIIAVRTLDTEGARIKELNPC
jgi:hypothetical protein